MAKKKEIQLEIFFWSFQLEIFDGGFSGFFIGRVSPEIPGQFLCVTGLASDLLYKAFLQAFFLFW